MSDQNNPIILTVLSETLVIRRDAMTARGVPVVVWGAAGKDQAVIHLSAPLLRYLAREALATADAMEAAAKLIGNGGWPWSC